MDEERYQINSLLGKGRTGGVYAAEDTQLHRTVAVRRFYSAGGDTSSGDWETEFIAIAQNLGNLQDPNLLTVLDAGVDEDGAFLVAQLLDGTRLSELVVKTPLDQHEAHEMASQLLDALAHSHEAGFIHGALTAGSIMLTKRARGGYRYIIMDMGLSRLAPLIQGADSSYAMMADPALLAPELFDGEAATEVSDCYMLGHLVYLSLIGGHPFALKPIDTVKELHRSGALPPLTDYLEGLSPEFVDWIDTLTHPDISKRPQSAAAALRSLPKLPAKKSAPPAGAIAKKLPALAPTVLKKADPPAPARKPKPQVKAPVSMTPHPVAKQPTAATPVEAPQPPAAQHAAASKSPMVEEIGQAKSKKKLILAVGLPVLLITGVSLAVMLPKEEVESLYDESAENKPINAELDSASERANMTLLYSNSVEDGHSRLGCDVTSKGKLDWVVFRKSTNTDAKYHLPEGTFIHKAALVGSASEKSKGVGNLMFTQAQSKKMRMRPNLSAITPKVGDGWKVKLTNTKSVSPLTLKFHFSTWNCDAKLRIVSEDGSKEIIPPMVYQHKSQNTSFGTIHKLTEEQLKGQNTFYIELTALDVASDGTSSLSLNALILE